MKTRLFAAALLVGLAACGENPQSLVSNAHDGAAYTGTGKAFVNPDWKPGDKGSWESHMKARGQYGQNDYSRTN